ncbi:MAG: four helix bundle protein [Acidobacteria bacterium]|nr:four helix bundle protein [Acidobacteriota bacterium]
MDRKFEALEVAMEMAAALRPSLEALARRDRGLEDQVRRAAASVVLNIAEGAERRGKDRLQHYRIAAGSAAEVGAGLRLARVWGYVEGTACAEAEGLVVRVQQMLWRLTHGPG